MQNGEPLFFGLMCLILQWSMKTTSPKLDAFTPENLGLFLDYQLPEVRLVEDLEVDVEDLQEQPAVGFQIQGGSTTGGAGFSFQLVPLSNSCPVGSQMPICWAGLGASSIVVPGACVEETSCKGSAIVGKGLVAWSSCLQKNKSCIVFLPKFVAHFCEVEHARVWKTLHAYQIKHPIFCWMLSGSISLAVHCLGAACIQDHRGLVSSSWHCFLSAMGCTLPTLSWRPRKWNVQVWDTVANPSSSTSASMLPRLPSKVALSFSSEISSSCQPTVSPLMIFASMTCAWSGDASFFCDLFLPFLIPCDWDGRGVWPHERSGTTPMRIILVSWRWKSAIRNMLSWVSSPEIKFLRVPRWDWLRSAIASAIRAAGLVASGRRWFFVLRCFLQTHHWDDLLVLAVLEIQRLCKLNILLLSLS